MITSPASEIWGTGRPSDAVTVLTPPSSEIET